MKFDIRVCFENRSRKDFSLKSDNNSGTSHEDRSAFGFVSCSVLLRMGNVSDESFRENQKHIL